MHGVKSDVLRVFAESLQDGALHSGDIPFKVALNMVGDP